ncbi:MAG: Unknown protein [uncultured Sulfurovum sp.]|uniref:Uncharacterized protein n=1 Tax=uncultured Sulfurovum sp. TaxID=269237 RepID=A0A6S6ST58_9BACT|nr:MAG: Unknown protein [uncultured Sulfurovum sp.]
MFGKPKKEKKKKVDRFADLNGPTKMDEKFNWHNIIYKLITELNTTEKKVYKMNYISCLNWLSFFKNRDEVKEAQRKNNK